MRGIGTALTGDDESATATELGGGGHCGLVLGIGLGFEGKRPVGPQGEERSEGAAGQPRMAGACREDGRWRWRRAPRRDSCSAHEAE